MITRYLEWKVRNGAERLKDVKPILEWWDKQIGKHLLVDVNRSLISLQVEKLTCKTVKRFDKDLSKPYHVPIGPARVPRSAWSVLWNESIY